MKIATHESYISFYFCGMLFSQLLFDTAGCLYCQIFVQFASVYHTEHLYSAHLSAGILATKS